MAWINLISLHHVDTRSLLAVRDGTAPLDDLLVVRAVARAAIELGDEPALRNVLASAGSNTKNSWRVR